MRFEVETNQVASTLNQLEETLDQVRAKRQGMYNAINEMEGMWVGEAHSAFAQSYQNDNEMMIRLEEEIQRFIDAVNDARREYDVCEQEVQHMISAIRI